MCNRRYRELYELPPEVAKPGRTLQSLLDFRIAAGNFTRDPKEYREEITSAMRAGRTTHAEVTAKRGT